MIIFDLLLAIIFIIAAPIILLGAFIIMVVRDIYGHVMNKFYNILAL